MHFAKLNFKSPQSFAPSFPFNTVNSVKIHTKNSVARICLVFKWIHCVRVVEKNVQKSEKEKKRQRSNYAYKYVHKRSQMTITLSVYIWMCACVWKWTKLQRVYTTCDRIYLSQLNIKNTTWLFNGPKCNPPTKVDLHKIPKCTSRYQSKKKSPTSQKKPNPYTHTHTPIVNSKQYQ